MNPDRVPILYIAPWVDHGGPGDAVEWFECIDDERWAPSLITTQPSLNRRLHLAEMLAEEAWDLPDLMPGGKFPEFILGFIESRGVRLVHIASSRLAFDLLPDMACLPEPPAVVAQVLDPDEDQANYVRYVSRRYGNLVDAFSVADAKVKEAVAAHEIAPSRIETIPPGTEMGRRHDELYQRLIAVRPASSRWRSEDLFGEDKISLGPPHQPPAAPLRLSRTPPPERTVGVIVPCYRHGIFLDDCIRSVKAQTLAPAKIVVVDDGSDDPETIEALDRLDADPEIVVARLPVNGGPSIARNTGLAQLDTSYVLSIDADDQLLPDALERMLAQLEAAPENVGFVYPHAQHIGNRSDYVQLPAYNLWLLMKENYCPAPALFDRRVFAAGGVEYPEEIVVGHEDWDLILQLAEREVEGIHADGPTFLYRKQGFSRVNAVEYGPHAFHESIERRHPGLYLNSDQIKARWAPALSIVLLDEGGRSWSDADLSSLSRQTCRDFEVLAQTTLSDEVHAVEAAAGAAPKQWLQSAVSAARGRWACVLSPAAAATLRKTSFVEQLLYAFHADRHAFGIALGEAPQIRRHVFSQLDASERLSARPVGVAFERVPASRFPKITLSAQRPTLADLAVGLQASGSIQWRLASPNGDCGPPQEGAAPSVPLDLNERPGGDRSLVAMRNMAFGQEPRLPELTPGTVRRWNDLEGWIPSGTQPLCRHVDFNDIGRIVSNHRQSPPGYKLEFDLGAVQMFASPGTQRLIYADHDFELSGDQDALPKGRHGLGYVEQEALPMLERLELRQMPESGRHVLVAGPEDPLFDVAEPVLALGWIEAFPILPRGDIIHDGPWGVAGLRRYADHGTWRHVYGTEAVDEEPDAIPIGSLYRHPDEGLVELRLRDDGRLATDDVRPGRASRDPRKIGRWIAAAPGSNERSRSPAAVRARAGHLSQHFRARKLAEGASATLGWLRREDAPGCSALFSTTHPVTGDQLVTRFAQSAMDRGYLVDGVLGYVLIAGASDEAEEEEGMAPWASGRLPVAR